MPSARNVVRKILRACITCRKVSAKGSQQLMADLPAARVTACRVFSQVVPDPDYTEIPMSRLGRWQLVQRMNEHFWRKWSSEYLNRLQQRPKWCKGNVGFKEGDLVLVKPSENSDTLKWHLARILKLHSVMPIRKRGSLGRKTVKSKAVEHTRAAEAPDEKRARLQADQVRHSLARAAETPEQYRV
ncbi:uncharacterized protein TNCT_610581 [Trichonephila clavata]|uniref:DUF5641 domain-containing protein n=1 Tax=Trichonephila clavata TaxID=2740835 RepID=A0A8X6HUB9_TRICU|nr:uncharacterized protein TNCT_610581 [Trichonephila clavata]